MRDDKHLAVSLRKRGLSYQKISIELAIPKSTLSEWFSNIDWSKKIKKELTRKANYIARKRLRLINIERRKYWEKWRENFRKDARKEFPYLLKNALFIAGINLYWGEGDSKLKNGQVRLSNADPRMIALFIRFLLKIARVRKEKIFAWLLLYPDLHDKKCKLFWSKHTGIPFERFGKSQFIQGRHPTKKIEHGVCTIQISNRGLKEKIILWIDLFYNHIKTRV